jgi:pyridoxal phosphate enzyme (YggS family)
MVRENIVRIKERIISACFRVNRDPSGIKIVAVSKGRGVLDIKEALASGLVDIGENRIQETLDKFNKLKAEVSGPEIQWHMIGHLQKNKVKDAVGIFQLIHSVDSLVLAEEINKRAAKINKIQDILLEVKTSPETTKSGLGPDKVKEAIGEISRLKNINIKGLMTIAPLVNHPEEARSYFKKLRELRESMNAAYILSMGMTDDFEVAIEEGADIIRIGRGIFQGAQG